MDIPLHLVAIDAMGPDPVDPRHLGPGGKEVSPLFILKGKSKHMSKVLLLLMLVPFAAGASTSTTTHSRRCNCIRDGNGKAL